MTTKPFGLRFSKNESGSDSTGPSKFGIHDTGLFDAPG